MRMIILLLAACLAGCVPEAAVKPAPPTPQVQVVTTPKVAAPKPKMSKKEWKRLTQDCQEVPIPEDSFDREVEDVATDVANARKAALEECTARMRKLRAKGGPDGGT